MKDKIRLIATDKWSLTCLALSTLMASLGMSISNVALPTLSEKFAVEMQTVQWVVIAYLIAIMVSIVHMGKLADMLGRKKVFLYGIVIFSLASMLYGLSFSFGMLLVSRGLQGIGAAVLIALPMATIQEIAPKDKTGAAMGLLGTMSAIGTMLGPTLGGLIISSLDWHFIFFLFVPFGLLSFILAKSVLHKKSVNTKFKLKQIDFTGTFFLTVTLLCYTLAVTIGESTFKLPKYGLILTAIIALALFIYTEKKARSPLLDLNLLFNKKLNSGLITNTIVATVMMSTLIVGPFYLTYALGFKEKIVGLILSIGPLASSVSGIIAGRIVDKWGASFVVVIGLVVMFLATLSLALLPTFLGLAGYILSIIFLTPGYQLFLAANNTDIMTSTNQKTKGLISGILNLSRNLGLITGSSVMGVVFTMAVGNQEIATAHTNDILNGMKITYLLASMLVLGSIFLVWSGKTKCNQK